MKGSRLQLHLLLFLGTILVTTVTSDEAILHIRGQDEAGSSTITLPNDLHRLPSTTTLHTTNQLNNASRVTQRKLQQGTQSVDSSYGLGLSYNEYSQLRNQFFQYFPPSTLYKESAIFEWVAKRKGSEYNWVDWGAVSPAQNQGSTQHCWAYAAAAAIESAYQIAIRVDGKVTWHDNERRWLNISERFLTDCCPDCGVPDVPVSERVGDPLAAFSFMSVAGIIQQGQYGPGVDLTTINPYSAEPKCRGQTDKIEFEVAGALTIPNQWPVANGESFVTTEWYLLIAVMRRPVVVGIKVNATDWGQGCLSADGTPIIYDGNCPSDSAADHAVLVVGFGVEPGSQQRYWIVKNSYGAGWCSNGYIYMIYGKNKCGISNRPVMPIIQEETKDAPTTVTGCAYQHTIKAGEDIFSIAQQYSVTAQDIMNVNPSILYAGAISGMVGQNLNIPPCGGYQPRAAFQPVDDHKKTCKSSYKVEAADETLYSVANKHRTSVAWILFLNPNFASQASDSPIAQGTNVIIPSSCQQDAVGQRPGHNAANGTAWSMSGSIVLMVLGVALVAMSRAF